MLAVKVVYDNQAGWILAILHIVDIFMIAHTESIHDRLKTTNTRKHQDFLEIRKR